MTNAGDKHNKASAKTRMQQEAFNVVVKTIEDQRLREEQEASKQANQRIDTRQDHEDRERRHHLADLSRNLKSSCKGYDTLHTILFEIDAYYNEYARVLLNDVSRELKRKGININLDVSGIHYMDKLKSGVEYFRKGVRTIKDKVTDPDPDIFLPGLIHFVELGKDSTLLKEPLRFTSSVELSPEQHKLFNESLSNWLNERGYTVDLNNPNDKVKDANGVVLAPEKFIELRDDAVTGLTEYLKNDWKMQVELKKADDPRPAPTI